MRKMLISLTLLLSAVIGGCTSVNVDPGQEAVCTDKPWFFGSGGVVETPYKTGLHYAAFSYSCKIVDVRPKQYPVEFDDLMTSNGIPLDFHSVITLRICNTPKMNTQFGDQWYENNVLKTFESEVRHEILHHTSNEVVIGKEHSGAVAPVEKPAQTADGKPAPEVPAVDIARQIDERITAAMLAHFKKIGLPVCEDVNVTLGRANPPEAIKQQRIATATQEERKNTEGERKNAEDARKQAEEARAAADNAYLEKMRLDPSQYVTLEQIKMLSTVCAGGKCTFFLGGGAGGNNVQLTHGVQ